MEVVGSFLIGNFISVSSQLDETKHNLSCHPGTGPRLTRPSLPMVALSVPAMTSNLQSNNDPISHWKGLQSCPFSEFKR